MKVQHILIKDLNETIGVGLEYDECGIVEEINLKAIVKIKALIIEVKGELASKKIITNSTYWAEE